MPMITNFYHEVLDGDLKGSPDFSSTFGFSPTFAGAGDETTVSVPNVTISGGVLLGSPTNFPGPDHVVYGTTSAYDDAHPGMGLLDTITISYSFPNIDVKNFSVDLFNSNANAQGLTFLIGDDVGDSTSVFLAANSSQNIQLPKIGVGTGSGEVTIESVTPGDWNFEIDNIVFNYDTSSTFTLTNPAIPGVLVGALRTALAMSALSNVLDGDAQDLLFALQVNLLYAVAKALQIQTDPFDPNYTQAYTPTFAQLPTIQPDTTVTQQTANDANTTLLDMSQAAAYLQAIEVTMNRLTSAQQAGDQASVALQSSKLDLFQLLSSSSLAATGNDLNTLANDLTGLPSITPNEILNFATNVANNGFSGLPQQEQALFNLFGLSSTDEQNIVNDLLNVNLLTVPTSVVSALHQAASALQDLGSVYAGTFDDTNIPAVAVEGSMYSAVGTEAEIAKLVNSFLPAQVANAIQNNFDPTVYACEALGLAFAFGNESGGQAFVTNFGSANAAMPATPAGDAVFAAAAATVIFGLAATANTPGAILQFVSNWEAFYTAHGVPGIPNATTDQIDLAARGAAWGDAVGVALANNLGSLPGQVTNFLDDVAQGTAVYSASFSSQPTAAQGTASAAVSTAADHVQLIGVTAPEHIAI
jgi:hypothetical protein